MGRKKEFIGIVISDKMHKTIIVRITRTKKHPKYNRIIKKYTKFKVHDEKGVAKIGDSVRIQETRPLSKDKRFKLLAVVKKTQIAHLVKEEEIK
jgi:small subunit ribosomal protein S17